MMLILHLLCAHWLCSTWEGSCSLVRGKRSHGLVLAWLQGYVWWWVRSVLWMRGKEELM